MSQKAICLEKEQLLGHVLASSSMVFSAVCLPDHPHMDILCNQAVTMSYACIVTTSTIAVSNATPVFHTGMATWQACIAR